MIRLRYREISQGRWVQCQPRELQMFCLFRAPKKRDQFLIGGRYLSEHGGDSNASEVLSFAPWVPLCFFFGHFYWGPPGDSNKVTLFWSSNVGLVTFIAFPKGRFTIPKRSRFQRNCQEVIFLDSFFFWWVECVSPGIQVHHVGIYHLLFQGAAAGGKLPPLRVGGEPHCDGRHVGS